jgi:mono/diheme cytochrome c family protein
MTIGSQSKARAIRLGVVFPAIVCAGIVLGGRARAATDNGWYTQAQAAQGQQSFNNYCAQCHRPDLRGAMGPALVGDAFLKQWSNKPITDLYSFEHSSMPANNPGSVPADKLWAITAFILQKNGFPAGSTALAQPTATNRMLTAK